MRIGLVQVDGSLPNIAIMKIAGFYENLGYAPEWYNGALFADQYDLVYASKIFKFSELPQLPPSAKIGGTGIDFYNRLPEEIEAANPSYSLYPNWKSHIGFSMKGCRFSCSFCCVPKKEGKPYKYSAIDDLLINPNGGNRLNLLDNDFFGTGDWEKNLNRIIELKLKVNFNQGLNIRILTDRQAKLLAKCKYYNTHFTSRYLTFAWDRFEDRDDIMKGIERCDNAGIRRDHLQFFVLIGYDTTHEQNLDRVTTLRELGCMTFVMPYDKFDDYQQRFSRWANSRQLKYVKWEDYKHNYKEPFKMYSPWDLQFDF